MSALLECKNLYQAFGGGRKLLGPAKPKIQAVSDVNLQIQRGQTLGIVGESGCGKSTLARMLVGLDLPSSGDIYFQGKDLVEVKRDNPRWLRQQIQFVFQDPLSSLNPRKTIRQILEAPLRHLLNKSPTERQDRLQELMQAVNLRPEFLDRYPHEFSGGQSQRIGIARALAAEPDVMILDEPVSALDVSVQAQILNLLRDLKQQFNLTYVFISHDLAVVENLCDTVAVMYLGRVVESASREQLFNDPKHPYTRILLSSVPVAGQKKTASVSLQGELPNPAAPPPGCAFAPRCYRAEAKCRESRPPLEHFDDTGRKVACYFAEDSDLHDGDTQS
ncbi:MAG: ATP-binding cassette domain-containing protein [Gammaproteobacteria bacterium]|jgi:peptide/nickel transport system ATP-binding protein|nr:ATP-binding cassette domain-containing protein [Gammaproteobacteria bacterium]